MWFFSVETYFGRHRLSKKPSLTKLLIKETFSYDILVIKLTLRLQFFDIDTTAFNRQCLD